MLHTVSRLDGVKGEMSSSWLHYRGFYEKLYFQTHMQSFLISYLIFVFYFTVQSESGCANVVSAAPCLAEPQQYEVQFGRLRNFLTGNYQEARKKKVAHFFCNSSE